MQNGKDGIVGICVICLREDRKLMRCSRCREISYCGQQCQRSHWKFHKIRCGPTKKPLGKGQLAMGPTVLGMCGKTGLFSFGNTCFLNSAIQCLSGVEDFMRYFISDEYKKDINKSNVLGHGGQVAETYGNLSKQLWFGNELVVVPKQLTEMVAKLWTQFAGFGAFQHQDSQEFLNFLLDALHEDLNRITEKPYVPLQDSEGRPDDQVAEEFWKNHRARNDSVVLDKFQGQFKSALVCSVCESSSVSFDPFLSVSMPIPGADDRIFTVFLISKNGTRPVKLRVKVPSTGLVKQLTDCIRTQLASYRGGTEEDYSYVVTTLDYDRPFKRVIGEMKPIRNLEDATVLCVHEVESKTHTAAMRTSRRKVQLRFRLRVRNSKRVRQDDSSSDSDDEDIPSSDAGELEPFSWPFIEHVDGKESGGTVEAVATGRELFQSTLTRLKRVLRQGTVEGIPANEAASVSSNGAFPFLLYRTSPSGKGCNFEGCTHGRSCNGHAIYPNDEALDHLRDRQEIAVELTLQAKTTIFKEEEANTVVPFETKTRDVTLTDCLDAFTAEEMLEGDDSYFCKQCKQHVSASKKMQLWRLPEVFLVFLKRFKHNVMGTGERRRAAAGKVSTPVLFPKFGLNLAPYCAPSGNTSNEQNSLYELFGVVNHYGTLEAGHYTAHVRHKEHGIGRPPNPTCPFAQTSHRGVKENPNSSLEDGYNGELFDGGKGDQTFEASYSDASQTSNEFLQDKKGERWWCFDDEKVKRWRADWWDAGKVKQYCAGQGLNVPDPALDDLPLDPSAAYILFYRRKQNEKTPSSSLAQDMSNLQVASNKFDSDDS